MTPPASGFYFDQGPHVYYWNGRRVPSVTTIINTRTPRGLVYWKQTSVAETALFLSPEQRVALAAHEAHEAPEAGCEVCGHWDKRKATAANAAARWAVALTEKRTSGARDLGTLIHKYAEEMAYGVEPADLAPEHRPYVEAYNRWVAKAQPEDIEAECHVINLDKDYAGTVDRITRLNGRVTLLDLKTGSSIGDFVDLQLAAYGRADGIVRSGSAQVDPLPPIERYGVLHINPSLPDGYEYVPMTVTERAWRLFVAERQVYDRLEESARKWRAAKREAA